MWGIRCGSGLLTDLYELSMNQAYRAADLERPAAFEMYFRKLPATRNYLLAAGLADLLTFLEDLSFDERDLRYLRSLGQFSEPFIDSLAGFRFTGDVRAVPEGTPLFADEPVVQVEAPLPQAQLVETMVLNQVHAATLIASKASRCVTAAAGRPCVDFGFRRAVGLDAGVKLARCGCIAGFASTSNVEAGARWGLPVSGTMAHSFVEAHDDERAAFRHFAEQYPNSILLIDTYDTLRGADRVIELAGELGEDFRIRGVRIDSGDLCELSRKVRAKLDGARLNDLNIVVSGGLDEHEIDRLVRSGAPVDGFGVGTQVAVSADAPHIDCAYKMVEYDGRPRLKLSADKATLPGQKQVFRRFENGEAAGDTIAQRGEEPPGQPLLVSVMEGGVRTEAGAAEPVDRIRQRAADELQAMPERVRALPPADPPYPVDQSEALNAEYERLRRQWSG